VQVIGAQQKTTTDSSGKFFVALKKGGSYFVRIHHAGFVEQLVTVDVPTDRSVETFVLLDGGAAATGSEMLWADFDERMNWVGQSGAVIRGSEIERWGGSTADAVAGSQSFVRKGLMLGPTTCVFVDGVPRPGLPLDAIPPEQIEAVEVYTQRGDETNTLAPRWPHGAQCGRSTATIARPASPGAARSTVVFAVIWLKH
jgi:hypothetical protein